MKKGRSPWSRLRSPLLCRRLGTQSWPSSSRQTGATAQLFVKYKLSCLIVVTSDAAVARYAQAVVPGWLLVCRTAQYGHALPWKGRDEDGRGRAKAPRRSASSPVMMLLALHSYRAPTRRTWRCASSAAERVSKSLLPPVVVSTSVTTAVIKNETPCCRTSRRARARRSACRWRCSGPSARPRVSPARLRPTRARGRRRSASLARRSGPRRRRRTPGTRPFSCRRRNCAPGTSRARRCRSTGPRRRPGPRRSRPFGGRRAGTRSLDATSSAP